MYQGLTVTSKRNSYFLILSYKVLQWGDLQESVSMRKNQRVLEYQILCRSRQEFGVRISQKRLHSNEILRINNYPGRK